MSTLCTAYKYVQIGHEEHIHKKTFKVPKNRFQRIDSASLCSLAGRYDNPIPTMFLASIDCSKIPAQNS